MRKISEDIMGEAYDEIAVENDAIRKSAEIDKTAFDVSINPASLIGALTGAVIAKKKIQSDNLKRLMESENSSVLQGNYYQQVQNLVANLKIIFTPFGVVYVVRNASKEITIETIGTDEMNSPMYTAWKQKDAEYFKHVLLNKMHSEIQFVEQEFAKKVLENHMGLQAHITKKASDVDYSDISTSELMSEIADMKEFYEKQTDTSEKLAEILCRMTDDGTEYRISWEFQRPLEKYALLGGALDFLGFGGDSKDIRSLQGSYLSPSYLANRVKAGFLPDRVIFIVDNKVISSLLAVDMNAEAFDYFQKQDQKFFVSYFNKEAKKGIKRMQGKLPPNSDLIKEASSAGLESIFDKVDVHPMIYFKMLNEKYGAKWTRWEVASLIKTLEQDFALEEGMNDQALNKIMSIHAVNNNLYPFTNYHVFEKIIRSFAGKPIDFLEREIEDLDTEDIAFGLEVMDAVTPKVDTFQSFSSEVINYIINNLLDNQCRVFHPISLFSDSESRNEFYEHINEYLLDGFNSRDLVVIDDEREQAESIRENEVIHHISMNIILKVRSQMSKEFNQSAFIKSEVASLDESETVKNIIDIQIVNGLLIDRMLIRNEVLLKAQQKLYSLK